VKRQSKTSRSRKSWVMLLPSGLRERPEGFFIGSLCAISGALYLLGIAESTAITRVLDHTWLRIWGGGLALSGILIIVSLAKNNKPLEAFGQRCLSLSLIVYIAWAIIAVGIYRSTLTVAICLMMVGMSEIRVGVIKTLLKPLPITVRDTGGVNGGSGDSS